ncbi:hypothetical protein ONZ51_g1914 [Trametes cubensis]|uniref:Dienelactone hydrolase domain-containing protein n=1 Tax=Trametes cubensis TaxID=1111947 RepID=A0AAD7U390_9APHY|nr:hypothetical protein ONZ51_g1914 [Trametes cubensis]
MTSTTAPPHILGTALAPTGPVLFSPRSSSLPSQPSHSNLFAVHLLEVLRPCTGVYLALLTPRPYPTRVRNRAASIYAHHHSAQIRNRIRVEQQPCATLKRSGPDIPDIISSQATVTQSKQEMSAQAGTDAGASTVSTQQLEQDDVPLTGPLGKCCTRTVPHSGVARGTVEVIAGLATRRRGGRGERGGKVILYFADVFGPLYINSKLAMDYWAAHGYLVLGVDYFEGDSAAHHRGEAGWDVDEWVVPFRTSAARITPPWIEAVREAYGACARIPHIASGCRGPNTKFFTVDWVTAGAIAHPAFLDEGHFRRLKKPLLISSPEDDFTFPSAARRRAEDIMVEQKATYYIQIFSGAVHGFATRPDPSLRAEQFDARLVSFVNISTPTYDAQTLAHAAAAHRSQRSPTIQRWVRPADLERAAESRLVQSAQFNEFECAEGDDMSVLSKRRADVDGARMYMMMRRPTASNGAVAS